MSKTRCTGISDLKDDDSKAPDGTSVRGDAETALANRKARPHIVALNIALGLASIAALMVCAYIALQLLRS